MRRSRSPLTAARLVAWCLSLAALLGLCLALAAAMGAGQVSLADLLPGGTKLSDVDRTILFEVRVPRVLLAALLGGEIGRAHV